MNVATGIKPGPIVRFRGQERHSAIQPLSSELKLPTHKVLPDSGGEISEIYFHYPAAPGPDKIDALASSARAVISELATQLVGQPAVYLALESAENPEFGNLAVKPLPLNVDDGYIWARDGATAATDNNGNPTLILSDVGVRRERFKVADQGFDLLAAAHPELKIAYHSEIGIQDGQRVANSRHSFLSERAVKWTARMMQGRAEKAGLVEEQMELFQKERGVKVLRKNIWSPHAKWSKSLSKEYYEGAAQALEQLDDTEAKREALQKYRVKAEPEFNRRLESPPAEVANSNIISYQEMWDELAVEHLEAAYGEIVRTGQDHRHTIARETADGDHIDMLLTPVDDETIVVGSTDLALQLFEQLSPEERSLYNQRISASIGSEGDHLEAFRKNLTWNEKDQFGPSLTSDVLGTSGLTKFLNRTAKEMEGLGYNVVRVPCLVDAATGLPHITYNNVLMENGPDDKVVHLPSYGLDALDNAAREAYENLGFRVDPVGEEPIEIEGESVYPMLRLTKSRGALRCLSQVLTRRS